MAIEFQPILFLETVIYFHDNDRVMPLKIMKCPNCNGEISFDDKIKQGFCMYCGSRIVNEPEKVNKIKFDTDDAYRNMISLSKKSLQCGEKKKAVDCADNALDLNPDSPDGWYLKAAVFVGIDNLKAASCYNMAVRISGETGTELFTKEEFNKYSTIYLDTVFKEHAKDLIRVFNNKKHNVDDIENTKKYLEGRTYVIIRDSFPALWELALINASGQFEKVQKNVSVLVYSHSTNMSEIFTMCMEEIHNAALAIMILNEKRKQFGEILDALETLLDSKELKRMDRSGHAVCRDTVILYRKWISRY